MNSREQRLGIGKKPFCVSIPELLPNRIGEDVSSQKQLVGLVQAPLD
jgi:hypothetical protein